MPNHHKPHPKPAPGKPTAGPGGPLPSDPTPGALRALNHAKAMLAQTDPAIWFDSWSNDLRDNDLDGRIDDPRELAFAGSDGRHYPSWGGKPFYPALVAPIGRLTTDQAPSWALETIHVTYKVCIDVPIESYKAAGVPLPSAATKRWIPSFFNALKSVPGWQVWDRGEHPPSLKDGDIVAASNPAHQHAGIVETGDAYDSIINLPGPTSRRRFLVFYPSGRNDMTSVPRWLFEEIEGIDLFARWTRP